MFAYKLTGHVNRNQIVFMFGAWVNVFAWLIIKPDCFLRLNKWKIFCTVVFVSNIKVIINVCEA